MKIGIVLLMAALVWCFTLLIILVYTPKMETNFSEITEDESQNDALVSVQALRSQLLAMATENTELRYKNRQLTTKLNNRKGNKPPPTLEHERLRRKLALDVRELGYYIQSQIAISKDMLVQAGDSVRNLTRGAMDELNQTIGNVKGYIRTTMSDFKRFEDLNREWRQEKSKSLSKSIQTRIHQVMNPENCQEKKKLICDLKKHCGFGCQLHHIIHCLNSAIYYGRPLVLDSKGWRYSPDGWEMAFKPISDTCQNVTFGKRTIWTGDESVSDIFMEIVDFVGNVAKRKYLPLAIPEELAPDLVRIHGNPAVWWIGQLTTYLWRHQPILSRYINEVKQRIGYKTPIVGVHIRRTDKVNSEAASHPIEEYMNLVEEYYNERELTEKVDTRRVFLATDEVEVVQKARKLYPRYEIINDPGISKSAGSEDKRYAFQSLLGVVTDIHFLAHSDFIVCTFSSNVCRTAYELMQAIHGDASQSFNSLDDVYYFGGQNDHLVRAIQRHVPRDRQELALIPGDKISLLGNQWNGYSKGRHKINRKVGYFPSYKVEDTVPVAKYSVKFIQEKDQT